MPYINLTIAKRARAAVLAVVTMAGFAAATPAFAISCNGNACGDVELRWDGSCYTVINHGSDRVRVQIGSGGMGTVKMTLRGGQTSRPIINPFGGGCRTTLGGSMRANYM